ncbi:MAG TPA: chemotaxis-specific protein-glutamate methyltransferase CheB [Baekduia sp.]|nr:chemotaxis-specific protein-glutamate methyltransferase CheB [Baekduia sp.]
MLPAPRIEKPPRILVADDSSFMRRLLTQALRDAGFDVVAEAADGDEALALSRELRPDAMTLDLAMPGMDGIGVLRGLRALAGGTATTPAIPVVVVSAFSPAHGARAVDALAEGAFDLVAKPAFGEPLEQFVAALREKVSAAAASSGASVAVRRRRPRAADVTPLAPSRRRARRTSPAVGKRVVLIATSTGGPRALAELVPALPSPLGAGGLIVQHMPAGFTASLAQRLDRSSRLSVVEAAGGEPLRPDTLLLAPGGSHLRLGDDGVARLSDEAAVGGLRPRADLTIEDAARIYGERLLLVVMTGMGKDGLDGARQVRAHGGRILAEAESTCTVYGMPRAIVEAGLADAVVPLGELAAAITTEVGA